MTARSNHRPARPFLKWAGGKGQMLAQYEAFFPAEAGGAYFEPFVGSGAVFFHLQPRGLFERYVLSDANAELVNLYQVVRDQPDALLDCLRDHAARHSADYYYTVRALDRDAAWAGASPLERAARMLYLNRTCYNGLWRVNGRGHFNVPLGRYRTPDIYRPEKIHAASQALQAATLTAQPFDAVLDRAQPGDFVYFDPPYVPVSQTANFTGYSADSFGEAEQRHLAEVFAALAAQGCRVMLSNSDTPLVHELYADFRIEKVAARRAINSKAGRRGQVYEVVVLSG